LQPLHWPVGEPAAQHESLAARFLSGLLFMGWFSFDVCDDIDAQEGCHP